MQKKYSIVEFFGVTAPTSGNAPKSKRRFMSVDAAIEAALADPHTSCIRVKKELFDRKRGHNKAPGHKNTTLIYFGNIVPLKAIDRALCNYDLRDGADGVFARNRQGMATQLSEDDMVYDPRTGLCSFAHGKRNRLFAQNPSCRITAIIA